MSNSHYHTIIITLTTVSLLSSTINRSSLLAPDPLTPPNSAALLLPTGVSVKLEHGEGGCPVMSGELHFSAGVINCFSQLILVCNLINFLYFFSI